MTRPLPETPGVGAQDVVDAGHRLKGLVVTTPLVESPVLNASIGGRLLVKAECLQRTGSFKMRGATNALAQMDDAARARGVITHSSGNHGQALASAARAFGLRATVVMPDDAPALKIELTRAHGAEVVFCPRHAREQTVARLAGESGAVVIHPYETPAVIAGQGTVGLEIVEQCAAIGVVPDQVLVCCGGGGLTAGVALAIDRLLPGVPVIAVEPEGWDDTKRSLAAGAIVANDGLTATACDALQAMCPGTLSFSLNRHLLAGAVSVDEAMVRHAMRQAFVHLKLVAEPGGAVALAAALAGKVETADRLSVVVLSGGNVDPGRFASVLAGD
ncbi:threonine ammonia-lyase [Rhodospirillum rubrum]|uniref:L-threonine ammonia-lyase n=1 Tax=Rhodospirillum rubrum (strain ATCC 11170 / ATH 1.1.1 / DSM 467 / LMG 4362 / NCIMB 8255 / S1) TaxID=269796 RepID=Q2RWP4_RHORT|nr:threonine/serine dehydratase [Rhodospirillum rubrum]ABC21451.1 L-threonine ammonia-lyase [Rhodospirillum rubrum ATCC 11170]AEO47133.1 L-threonine ammonia-lyase [Rhodospirillum rubrum F11]MBK5953045.1 threonine/serine dehydratase [Rhodospirillum rubrum]QXG81126.1 threonine/serine dehydratase [Rhodospirillum rubrum]HAQ01170.1 threonine/serine dehydratase [Rhodospirillum rubrum]